MILGEWLRLESGLPRLWKVNSRIELRLSLNEHNRREFLHNAVQEALHTVDTLIFVQCVNSSKTDTLNSHEYAACGPKPSCHFKGYNQMCLAFSAVHLTTAGSEDEEEEGC